MSHTGTTTAKAPQIGVIGLGAMGRGMALNALGAGYDLYGHDLSAQAQQNYVGLCESAGLSARIGRPHDIAGHDIVFTVLTDAAQTEALLFGPSGIAVQLRKGAIVVMCSTLAPNISADFAARLAAMGLGYLDAPISGGWQRAEAGSLTIICAGERATYDRVLPLLQTMGEDIFYMGAEAGAANRVKLINQLMVSAHLTITAEAMTMAAKAGLDLETFAKVITTSAGSSRIFEMRTPDILKGDFTAHAALDLMVKDVGLVLEQADELQLSLPVAEAVYQRFRLAQGQGHGRASTIAVIKTYSDLDWGAETSPQ